MKTNDPWARMDELLSVEFLPDEVNWFTVRDFVAKYKLNERTARDKLDKWERDGIVEKRRGMTSSCKKPQNYFRLL
jgi:hypothetical protein